MIYKITRHGRSEKELTAPCLFVKNHRNGGFMATTNLMPRHVDKGRTILKSIKDSIDYGKNPDKTRNGQLISSYECDARTAHIEFILSKNQYASETNRSQKNDVLLYQLRQSFKPGEITPEDANRISYELAMAFTKGRHAFIVTTHEDKKHIHSHIYFNSTSIDCNRKFRNFWGSARAIRRISDQICVENGLSIVENPKPSKGNYGTWLGDDKPVTWQEKLKQAIDAVLDKKPADLTAFVQAMKALGYEVKQGKYLSFCAPEQKKFTRLRSLGDDYNDNAILERIEGKRIVSKREPAVETTAVHSNPKMNLLIDIQNNIKAKNSPGYEQWAKVFNLKQAAQTLIYLQENNLTDYNKLEEKTTEATQLYNDLTDQIKIKEARLNEISSLQKHIGNYSRTRDVYVEYRKSGYSKKFLAEHEGDIILHQASKKAFDELGLQKLPTIKTLQTEYATLLAEKKKLYQSYRQAKDSMRELLTAKNNTDRILGYSSSGQAHEKDTPKL